MSIKSNVSKKPSSMEVGLFNQIAMFSVSGIAMSMALILVGGVQILDPWF